MIFIWTFVTKGVSVVSFTKFREVNSIHLILTCLWFSGHRGTRAVVFTHDESLIAEQHQIECESLQSILGPGTRSKRVWESARKT